MPDWQSPIYDDDPPWQSQPKRKDNSVKIVIGLLAGGIVLFGLCFGGFLYLIWPKSLPTKVETLKQKQAALQAAFSADDIGVSEDEFNSIDRFVAAFVKATQGPDELFVRFVDLDRHIIEIKRAGILKTMAWMDEQTLHGDLTDIMTAPTVAQRYRIAHVDLDPVTDEAVVYVLLWLDNGHLFETRVWLIRNRPGWKAFDWELLQYGVRESAYHAMLVKYQDDPRLDGLIAMRNDLEKADNLYEQDNSAAAKAKIRSAERHSYFPELKHERVLEFAFAWDRCGFQKESMEVCLQATQPELVPGVLMQLSSLYGDQGMHQESLDFALRYERAIGGGPNVNQLKADAYENLDRDSDAAAAWQDFLKGDPENLPAMLSLGRLLKPDDLVWLAEYVSNLENTVETATTLSESFINSQNLQAAAVMIDVLKKSNSQLARVAYLEGRQFENDEWYDEAAEKYTQAFQVAEDAEERDEYVHNFLRAMFYADRTLEGYAAAPDARQAFQHLASGLDDGDVNLPKKVMRQLIVAHKERAPKDPWLRYYTGMDFLDNEEYEKAIQEFDAGLKEVGDDNDRDSFSYERNVALALSGRAIEAYETSESKENAFSNMASTLRYAERFDELAGLVAKRRGDQADDRWIDYYTAITLNHKQQHQQADQLLDRATLKSTDETDKRQIMYLRLQLRLEADYRVLDYQEVQPTDEAFKYLVSEFTRRRRWRDLEKLLDTYESREPASGALIEQRIEFDWAMQNYQSVVDRLTPWPNNQLGGFAEWQTSQLRERLLRSHLRLDQKTEAQAIARVALQENQNQIPAILVAAANHSVNEVIRLFGERERFSYLPAYLYDDEDIGLILQSEPFLPLRQKFPPGLNFSNDGAAIVILLKQPTATTADQLTAKLSESLKVTRPAAEFKSHSRPNNVTRFLVSIDGHRYCITFGDSRYDDPDEPASKRVDDPVVKHRIDSHAAWISIHDFSENDGFNQANWARTCRLAATLCDVNALVLYFSDVTRLVAVSDAALSAIQNDEQRDLRIDAGENKWLYRKTEDADRDRKARRQRRRLREFEQSFKSKQPGQEFMIHVEYDLGGIIENLWLRLTEIGRNQYGTAGYVGELTSDSLLVPRLRKGEMVSAWRYNIIDLKFP